MGSIVSSVTGGLFGGKNKTGAFGTGQFQGTQYNIDPNAFNTNGLASYGQEQDSRMQQQNLANMLNKQALGQGPSLAQGQLRQATDRNISQQMGLAASQRGLNPALAQRLASQNIAGANQQAASDSGLLRNQEMLNAQSGLANVLGAQRTGDLAATDRDLSARMGREQLGVQQQTGLNSVNQAGFDSSAKRRGDLISNIGGGLASVFAEGGMVKADGDPSKVGDGSQKSKSFLKGLGEAFKPQPGASREENVAASQRAMGAGIGKGLKALFGHGDKPDLEGMGDANLLDKVPMMAAQGGVVDPEEVDENNDFKVKIGDGSEKNKDLLNKVSEGFNSQGKEPPNDDTHKKLGAEIAKHVLKLFGKGMSKGGMIECGKMNDGGEVPGRAETKGNSLKNDFVHALLSPGEIVIPRTHSKDPDKAKMFVEMILKQEKGA